MKTLYEHFEMLCFTDAKLPLYLFIYKWILYVIIRLHQGLFHKNWS